MNNGCIDDFFLDVRGKPGSNRGASSVARACRRRTVFFFGCQGTGRGGEGDGEGRGKRGEGREGMEVKGEGSVRGAWAEDGDWRGGGVRVRGRCAGEDG